MVGGGGWWWLTPILVLSLAQAEQYYFLVAWLLTQYSFPFFRYLLHDITATNTAITITNTDDTANDNIVSDDDKNVELVTWIATLILQGLPSPTQFLGSQK